MASSDVAEESVDSSQADISGWHTVFAVLLQMSQEGNNMVRFNVPKIQIRNLAVSSRSQEPKQQQQAITIAVHSVCAHAAKSGQVICKVGPQTESEIVGCFDLHAPPPPFCIDTGVTSPP